MESQMRIFQAKTTAFAAAAAIAGSLALGASAAQAGVTGCSASGGKQEAGALVGAALGGLVGNSVSGHNRTTGTVVGAVAGAAAGSAVGCEMQKSDPNQTADRDERPATYTSGGYRLSSQIQPARFSRAGGSLMVTRNFDMRAAPDFSSRYVGRLKGGEHVEAMARVRGSDWVLVGRNGVGLGYVHRDYIRADNDRFASY
jgi:hypothetical protein